MSSTDSAVVYRPRAAPSCCAHGATRRVSGRAARVRVAAPGSCSGPDAPVPRWSKTSRSRVGAGRRERSRREVRGERDAPPGPGRRRARRPPRASGCWSRPARVDAERDRAGDGAAAVERDRAASRTGSAGRASGTGAQRDRAHRRRGGRRERDERRGSTARASSRGRIGGAARTSSGTRRSVSVRRAAPSPARHRRGRARPRSGPTATPCSRRRAAVLLGPDPARPRQRRARRRHAGRAGAALPGEPQTRLRGRRHDARATPCA